MLIPGLGLTSIVNAMPSILIGIDQTLCVRHWNRKAEEVSGLKASQVCGTNLFLALPCLEPVRALIQETISENQPQTKRRMDWDLNGKQAYVELTVYPLMEEQISGCAIRIDDITEKVQLEEMMVQAEKMLSIGALAAGMAHEINNPLAGIVQNLQVIRNRFSDKLDKNIETAKECGTDITAIANYLEKRGILKMFDALGESGSRAARVIDNMLCFSRTSENRHSPQNLNNLVSRTLDLAVNDYDLKQNYDFRKIKIRKQCDDKLPAVPCSAGEIQQVLLNLLKNSAQAMAQVTDCRKPEILISTRSETKNVLLKIQDNGPGIPENVRRRIFEPFFTTKGVGLGTGLGLSVSYFIIREKHHGRLEIESCPGIGTTFLIYLPLIASKEKSFE